MNSTRDEDGMKLADDESSLLYIPPEQPDLAVCGIYFKILPKNLEKNLGWSYMLTTWSQLVVTGPNYT